MTAAHKKRSNSSNSKTAKNILKNISSLYLQKQRSHLLVVTVRWQLLWSLYLLTLLSPRGISSGL